MEKILKVLAFGIICFGLISCGQESNKPPIGQDLVSQVNFRTNLIDGMKGLEKRTYNSVFEGLDHASGRLRAYFHNDSLYKMEKSLITGNKAQFNQYYFWKGALMCIFQQEFGGEAPKLPLEFDKLTKTYSFRYYISENKIQQFTDEGPQLMNNDARVLKMGNQIKSEIANLVLLANNK